ncbi:MAG: DUF2007 domain-containing protein [Verrucomicrobiota bacterium]
MRELFREKDFSLVGQFRSLLESEGIQVHIRNEYLTGAGLTEIPVPEFYPALCVVNDEDYERAMEVIRSHLTRSDKSPGYDWTCAKCGEENPGNFEVCWSCGKKYEEEET